MKKVTQKFIREGIAHGIYKDINRQEPPENHRLEVIYLSTGIYGINGKVWQDLETGELYASPVRSLAIFKYN